MRRIPVCFAISLTVSACGTEEVPLETESTASGVLGSVSFFDCNFAQRRQLEDAMFLGRMASTTAQFESCILGINTGCVEDSSQNPADYLAITRGSQELFITCADLGDDFGLTDAEDIYWLSGTFIEEINVGVNYLADQASSESRIVGGGDIANTIWHETMHTHDFTHDSDTVNACTERPGTFFNSLTVPYRVGECLEDAVESLAFTGVPEAVQNLVLDELKSSNTTNPSSVPPKIARWMQGPRLVIRASNGNSLEENGSSQATFVSTTDPTEWRIHQPGNYCQYVSQTCNFVTTQPYSVPDFMLYAVLDDVVDEIRCLQRGSGSSVSIAECDQYSPEQRWVLSTTTNGRYYLGDVLTTRVLGAIGTPQEARMTTTYSSGELFIHVRAGEDVFIQAAGGTECADVPLPSSGNGQAIQRYTCNNGTNQMWYLREHSITVQVSPWPFPQWLMVTGLQMKSRHNLGMCLAADAAPALQQRTCSNSSIPQILELKLQPGLTYEVRTQAPLKCVTRTSANQWLQLQNCDGSAQQKWTLPVRR